MTMKNGSLQLDVDPFESFKVWWDEALRSGAIEPTAMTLATVKPDGRPAARVVLCKGFDSKGFQFFTNYNSPKADELENSPAASLVFFWASFYRQVRIEGRVEKVSQAESEQYFKTRPRGSQIGAWSSPQSQKLQSRDQLIELLKSNEVRFEGKEVPCPPHWGGYRVVPDHFEFWEGREFRLHERFAYRLDRTGWVLERLAP